VVLDFLQDWDIATIILAALVLMVVVLAASYGIALAWRRWKEGQRAKSARARGLPPPAPAAGATGTSFRQRASLTKLPKPGLRAPQLKVPKLPRPALPKLKKKA
jgi:hypothetical protein